MGGTEVGFGGAGVGILVGRAASLPGFGTMIPELVSDGMASWQLALRVVRPA